MREGLDKALKGKLFICATPIGNLSDASPRLLETLKTADLIAAEDTRHSGNLLKSFGISRPLTSYHEHSSKGKHEHILRELESGKKVALISDAGMPGISDPGEELIRDCVERGIDMTVIPGPMAGITALVMSGLPTGRFSFEGFLPRNRSDRRSVLGKISGDERTLVFYEAPHRLPDTLADMLQIFGDRKAALARELTKTFEEVRRGTLSSLLASVEEQGVKGELVLIVAGSSESTEGELPDPQELIAKLLSQGLSPAQAAKHAGKVCKLSRAELYALAVRLGREQE